MTHARPRIVYEMLLRKLKLWPIVGLVGPRQCGKSFLLSQLIAPAVSADYVSLDSAVDRARANASPDAFSDRAGKTHPLIIDEIQKAPLLFDALKLHVDRERRPGKYVVSGSTEFSKYSGIKEALTGRMALSHLYPLVLEELYQKPMGRYFGENEIFHAQIELSEFNRKVERGGMPGLCFLRSDREFHESWELWLEMTSYRDLGQVIRGKSDGALARDILGEVARQGEATASTIGKALRRDPRVITRYLDALARIFTIIRLPANSYGNGKDQYILFDSGLVTNLEGSRENAMRTHVAVEGLAYAEYLGFGRARIEYYRNAKSSRIPIVFTWPRSKNSPPALAVKIFDGETPHKRDFEGLLAFAKRYKGPLRLLMLTQTRQSYTDYGVEVHPLRG